MCLFFSFLHYLFKFLAVLDLCCCPGFFLVAASRGYPLVVVPGLLIAVRLINIVADQRPGGQQASVVEAQGL